MYTIQNAKLTALTALTAPLTIKNLALQLLVFAGGDASAVVEGGTCSRLTGRFFAESVRAMRKIAPKFGERRFAKGPNALVESRNVGVHISTKGFLAIISPADDFLGAISLL